MKSTCIKKWKQLVFILISMRQFDELLTVSGNTINFNVLVSLMPKCFISFMYVFLRTIDINIQNFSSFFFQKSLPAVRHLIADPKSFVQQASTSICKAVSDLSENDSRSGLNSSQQVNSCYLVQAQSWMLIHPHTTVPKLKTSKQKAEEFVLLQEGYYNSEY